MNCLIVDDNKLARTALRQLISQVDSLTVRHECSDSVEAFNYLKKEPVDLVFLDVEMPGMSGIELIKGLSIRPVIILITAKENYAVEAFELNVADYIIKPVGLERFRLAVDRARALIETNQRNATVSVAPYDKEFIFVRSNSMLTKIKVRDILYIQALGDYVNIHTTQKRHTVHITLKGIEEKLALGNFFRLHRSYLVSLNHVDSIEDGTAYVGKLPLPISEQFKKEFIRKLNLI